MHFLRWPRLVYTYGVIILFCASFVSPIYVKKKTSLSIRSYSLASQKVAMSNFEQDKYINYQRIEDNLQIVKKRLVTRANTICSYTRVFAQC